MSLLILAMFAEHRDTWGLRGRFFHVWPCGQHSFQVWHSWM